MRSIILLSTMLSLSSVGLMQPVMIHTTVAPATQKTGPKPVLFADLIAIVKNTGDEGDMKSSFSSIMGLTSPDKTWHARQRTDRTSPVQATVHQFNVGKDADGGEVALLVKKYNITTPPVMLDAFVCDLQGRLLVTSGGTLRAVNVGGGQNHAIPKDEAIKGVTAEIDFWKSWLPAHPSADTQKNVQ